jgi:hypothetical protein
MREGLVRGALYRDGRWRDSYLYGMTRDDWNLARRGHCVQRLPESGARWWSGGHDLAVRGLDAELPVRAEREDPALVMDAVVMPFAGGEEILEVGGAAALPRLDVMQPAVVVLHGAARDGAGGVERA